MAEVYLSTRMQSMGERENGDRIRGRHPRGGIIVGAEFEY